MPSFRVKITKTSVVSDIRVAETSKEAEAGLLCELLLQGFHTADEGINIESKELPNGQKD